MSGIEVLRTERLILRHLTEDDAPFILELLNEPGFIGNIGDRGVRDLDGARRYVTEGPGASYQKYGYGLWATVLRESGEVIGICGLVKREGLADIDIGFGFLPRYRSQGYAIEAARVILAQAQDQLGLERLVAITSQDNDRSANVLRKLGFEFEKLIRFPGEEKEIRLFGWKPDSPDAASNEQA